MFGHSDDMQAQPVGTCGLMSAHVSTLHRIRQFIRHKYTQSIQFFYSLHQSVDSRDSRGSKDVEQQEKRLRSRWFCNIWQPNCMYRQWLPMKWSRDAWQLLRHIFSTSLAYEKPRGRWIAFIAFSLLSHLNLHSLHQELHMHEVLHMFWPRIRCEELLQGDWLGPMACPSHLVWERHHGHHRLLDSSLTV